MTTTPEEVIYLVQSNNAPLTHSKIVSADNLHMYAHKLYRVYRVAKLQELELDLTVNPKSNDN